MTSRRRRHVMACHPATPCVVLDRVDVELVLQGDRLHAVYTLTGRVAQLRVPDFKPPARRDDLWRHLCCELFVRAAGQPGYCEFNFAPSGEWAAYAFTAYRDGMVPLPMAQPPVINTEVSASSLQLKVDFPLIAAGAQSASGKRIFGCSVVVEDSTGALTYWALRHPSGRPDFHHDDGFTGEMD